MKDKWKKLLGPALIIVMLAIVLISGVRSGELIGAIGVLGAVNPWFVAACGLCYIAYLFFDALCIRSALKNEGYPVSIPQAFKVSLTGEFYSSVTPGASGGQPMQVVELHKRNVPTGVTTSALVTHFIAFHIMLTVLMTVFGVPNLGFIASQVGSGMPILAVGYVYNVFMVALVIVLCLTGKPVRWAIDKIVRAAVKLRLTKDAQAMRDRMLATADTFHESMNHMRRHKKEIEKQLILSGMQLLSLMLVLVFVFHGLGLVGASVVQLTTMSLAQYISASYAPMPGASGAQEGVFSLFFSGLFPGSNCFAGMMLWRFMTYYLCLILGAGNLVINAINAKRKERIAETTFREQITEKIRQAKEEMKTASTERALELKEKVRGLEATLNAPDFTKLALAKIAAR